MKTTSLLSYYRCAHTTPLQELDAFEANLAVDLPSRSEEFRIDLENALGIMLSIKANMQRIQLTQTT
jgi:hypothetical protein